ncbi:hypothetical protein Btru_014796, partial [Bulinus truncatus]
MICSFQTFGTVLLGSLLCFRGILGRGIIAEVSCTTGKNYIFAVPLMIHSEPKMSLFLYAMKNREVEVYYAYNNDNAEIIKIPPRNFTQYDIKDDHISFTDQGPKPVYKLYSDVSFGLNVLMIDSSVSIDVIQVIPVEAWSRIYFAVTLPRTPSVQMFTKDGLNLIEILLKASFPYTFTFMYLGKSYLTDETFTVELAAEQGFSLSDCRNSSVGIGSISGTQITGSLPLGVISGSCYGATRTSVCETGDKYFQDSSRDIVADMLLPYAGKVIISPYIFSRRTASDVILMSTVNFTVVNVSDEPGMYQVHLNNSGCSYIVEQKYGAMILTGNEPFYAVFVLQSACHSASSYLEYGDPAMSVMPTVGHYYDSYGWSLPEWDKFNIKHYISVVVKTKSKDDVMVNEEIWATRHIGRGVEGTSEWYTLSGIMEPGVYYAYTRQQEPFTVYAYGLGPKYAYIFSARQLIADPLPLPTTTLASTESSSLPPTGQTEQTTTPAGSTSTTTVTTVLPCTQTETHIGDKDDNDCDNKIDEEQLDGKDNDGDGLIDEDLEYVAPKQRDGSWGEWSSWQCARNCSQPRYYRTRACDSPVPTQGGIKCGGDSKDSKSDVCFEGPKCPFECPDFTYGDGCSQRCDNCVTPCDKLDGACTHCKPGWRSPETGCQKECPEFFFGEMCRGDCSKKCGKDCQDKIFGRCIKCQEFKWGRECEETCSNCISDCSKTNGACTKCKAGFKDPLRSCAI